MIEITYTSKIIVSTETLHALGKCALMNAKPTKDIIEKLFWDQIIDNLRCTGLECLNDDQ